MSLILVSFRCLSLAGLVLLTPHLAAQTAAFPTPTEKLHPGWNGAVLDAECVDAGLKGLKTNPLGAFLSKRGQSIAPAATP